MSQNNWKGTGKKVAAVASSLVLVGSSVPAQVLQAIAPQVAWATDAQPVEGSVEALALKSSRITVSFGTIDETVVPPTSNSLITIDASGKWTLDGDEPAFGLTAGHAGDYTFVDDGGANKNKTTGATVDLVAVVKKLDADYLEPDGANAYTIKVNVSRGSGLTKDVDGKPEAVSGNSITEFGNYSYGDKGVNIVKGTGAGADVTTLTNAVYHENSSSAGAVLYGLLSGGVAKTLYSNPGYAFLTSGVEATSAEVAPAKDHPTLTVQPAITDTNDSTPAKAGSIISRFSTDASAPSTYYYGFTELTVGQNRVGGAKLERDVANGRPAIKVTAEDGFFANDGTNRAKSITVEGTTTVNFDRVLTADGTTEATSPANYASSMHFGKATVTFSYPSGITAADAFKTDIVSSNTISQANAEPAIKSGYAVTVTPGTFSDTATSITVAVTAALTGANDTAANTGTTASPQTVDDGSHQYGKQTISIADNTTLNTKWDGGKVLFYGSASDCPRRAKMSPLRLAKMSPLRLAKMSPPGMSWNTLPPRPTGRSGHGQGDEGEGAQAALGEEV